LGPTVDDITRQAVANATGRKLEYSTQLERQIAARFRSFGREMADNNKRQAYIPEGAIPLKNPVGTAPCFLSEDVRGRGFIISLPGVPRELEYMLEHTVLPLLAERMGGKKVMKVRILRTCAVGESNVDRAIGDLMTLSNPTVGLAAHPGQTDVRIAAKADSEAEADALIAPVEAAVRERLGVAIYGVEKETLAEVVGRLLAEKKLTLGVIDTLSGGLLARDLAEAGFGDLVATDAHPVSVAEAVAQSGVVLNGDNYGELARATTPPDGIGVALLGPFDDGATVIAVSDAGQVQVSQPGRKFQDSDYIRRWFATQGLDWVRRVLLVQLTSPADWN
jgi:molybdopterin-biosynthesis enzyme MoeA-like protein